MAMSEKSLADKAGLEKQLSLQEASDVLCSFNGTVLQRMVVCCTVHIFLYCLYCRGVRSKCPAPFSV